MLATLIAACIAVCMQFYHWPQEINKELIASATVILSLPFLILFPFELMLSWLPLQKAERHATPCILELFYHDKALQLIGGATLLFPLLTLPLAIGMVYTSHFILLLGGWILLFGMAIDALKHYSSQMMRYLNPVSFVEILSKKAKEAVRNNHEVNLCNWLDALSEIIIKGIQQGNHVICGLALDELENVARQFLEASKSIAHREQDKDTKTLGTSDKMTYVMFFIYQRLDMMFHLAVNKHLEIICNQMITIFGKLSINAAKCDMTLCSAPLRFLSKCANLAQAAHFEEVPITATCTLLHVAQTILTEIDVQYYEIKDTFLSIINGMEQLAKAAFRHNKQMNLKPLIQPFQDLRQLFDQPKLKDHQDVPIILLNIDRVIGEFSALESVMNTMPQIPNVDDIVKDSLE